MDNTENTANENQPVQKNKKRSYKKFIISFVIVVLIFSSVCGIVIAKKKFRDGPHGFFIEKMIENLNLTENQKAQVERIKTQIKEQMEANKPDRQNDMESFASEFRKEKLDKNALIELKRKKDENKEMMEIFMMDKVIEFHDILTPEQRNQVVENMKNMKEKIHDKMKKHEDKRDNKDSKD